MKPMKSYNDDDQLPLRRFASCSVCGSPLTGFLVKAKGLYYYKCKTNGCSCTKSAPQLHSQFEKELSKYEVDEKYHSLIKGVMKYTYEQTNRDARESKALVKRKVSEVGSKLEKIEEGFLLGSVQKELYEKYKIKYHVELQELEKELSDPEISSSNLNKAIDKALKMSGNLSEIWKSGNAEEKKQLQNLVFPAGIVYHKSKDKVQTRRTNSLFSVIPIITGILEENKNGDPINIDQISALVTSPGFKPGTS